MSWEFVGKCSTAYVVCACIVYMSLYPRSNDRIIGAFHELQKKHGSGSSDLLHTMFRIAAAAIWPIFLLAGALSSCKRVTVKIKL